MTTLTRPPQRVQRRMTANWRAPLDPQGRRPVYVGRPGRWGNPFVVGETVTPPVESYSPKPVYVRDAAHAVQLYRKWLLGSANRCSDLVPLLAGRDLMCWCPLSSPCHADVLLELANEEAHRDR
ncbi:DUF4326 domain-containing protein [Glycomyces sp. NPDC021274]|uniref:DUF4326 domain-containing protein n=1 Tax=Glycomyces sp. NPDC021274 TaxID=3155120 RepID=UPI003406F288